MQLRQLALALALISFAQAGAAAEPAATFELRFCAAIANYPASDRDRGGFDIELAELIADELGATATFTWTNFDEIGMRDSLHAGLCDVVIGVTEGVPNILTTVPYLNAPYAFVTRSASDLSIQSLDDPQLRELVIGTYQAGLPSIALSNRGIVDNVVEIAAVVRRNGVDADAPILAALLDGSVDVAIIYGPVAAAAATESAVGLDLTPVTPEIDFGARLLQLSRILTLGVRSHDEALRDRLNRVLAHRWDEVTAVLDAYEIPRLGVARPHDFAELNVIGKVGVILPAGTPAALPNATVGNDAVRGAAVADSYVSVYRENLQPVQVLRAHAPTLEATERAALRLLQVEQVGALVGGYSPEEARLLARMAAEYGVAYFNVASWDDSLRDPTCFPTTFHIAPSRSMMLAATMAAVATQDRSIALVVEAADGETSLAGLEELARQAGHQLADVIGVAPGLFVYFPLLQELKAKDPDTVILLMSSDGQEMLLSQAASLLPEVNFLGVSPIGGQSRSYLHRFLQAAPRLATQPRLVAWDPALENSLNKTFTSRTGEPLEPVAWSTFAGIVTAYRAAIDGSLASVGDLGAFLSEPQLGADLGKGADTRFRASDGQLLQELYVTQVDPDAAWGKTATARTAIARPLRTVPLAATEAVLGAAAACQAP